MIVLSSFFNFIFILCDSLLVRKTSFGPRNSDPQEVRYVCCILSEKVFRTLLSHPVHGVGWTVCPFNLPFISSAVFFYYMTS